MMANSDSRHGQSPSPPVTSIKELLKVFPDRELRVLLGALHRLYPNRGPDLKDTEREVWFKAGQRSVVDHLLRSYSAIGGVSPNVHRLDSIGSEAGGDPPATQARADQRTAGTGPSADFFQFFSGLLRKSS